MLLEHFFKSGGDCFRVINYFLKFKSFHFALYIQAIMAKRKLLKGKLKYDMKRIIMIIQVIMILKWIYQYDVHLPIRPCQTPITVFPVKPWTPEKISGMFIVSRPIRCEMKPQKITDKPQNGLFTAWHATTSSLFLPQGIFNFAVFKYWSFSFPIAALLSPKNRYERHFTKSEVNQEDRIRHS